MEGLVPVFFRPQDLDWLLDRRLGDQHGLVSPLGARDLFSMFFWYSSSVVAPIMCSSPRASAGLSMLPASIAPRPPGASRRWTSSMNTIRPSAFSVISSITPFRRSSNSPRYSRARDHACHVQRHQALAGSERLGHVVVDDPLGDALHDRGLADAGVAEQHRVVLRAAREDLDRLLNLDRPD